MNEDQVRVDLFRSVHITADAPSATKPTNPIRNISSEMPLYQATLTGCIEGDHAEGVCSEEDAETE